MNRPIPPSPGRHRPQFLAATVVVTLLFAFLVVAYGAAPVGASSSVPPPSTEAAGPGGNRVLVVGDSVLAGVPAAGDLKKLEAALPGWQVTFDAKECRSIQGPRKACGNAPGTVDGGLEAVQAHGEGFSAVVVQLGTNDAANPAAAQTTIASAKAILGQLAGVPHVYWLTIRVAGNDASGYAEFNRLLSGLPASYPNLTVVDWAAATKDRPELFGAEGLHLNNAGASYAVSVIADAVTDQLDASVPTVVASTSVPATRAAPSTVVATTTPRSVRAAPSSQDDNTTNIVIGIVVLLVLLGGIMVAVLAGRRRERKHRREERTARVEAALARGVTDDESRPNLPDEETPKA